MPAPPSAPAAAQPPRWQSVATVLLIVHFFCLAVGIAVNMGGGKSLVGQSLRNVPFARQYLQFLLMDTSYDFRLAGAEADDGVHKLELSEMGPSPTEAGPVIDELPSDGPMLRIRRQRYQQLAYFVAFFDDLFDENSDLRTQLPLTIVQRWAKAVALEEGSYVLRCLRIPSKRLPRAIAADITYAYVMREGGLQQQVVEKPPPDPITIFLVWDPLEKRYQGTRETPVGQRSEVVRRSSAPPLQDVESQSGAD
jgi:hypothetical protein